MRLARDLVGEMVEHARRDLPNECCGMVGGHDGAATTVYSLENAEASPFRYSISPQDLFRTIREIEESDEELVAIYHSHTKSEAYPSQTDVNLAGWPDAVYLIVSLRDEARPEIRGFWIREGEISEVDLVIE